MTKTRKTSMTKWKLCTQQGMVFFASGDTFAEACKNGGYDWRNCYVIAIY